MAMDFSHNITSQLLSVSELKTIFFSFVNQDVLIQMRNELILILLRKHVKKTPLNYILNWIKLFNCVIFYNNTVQGENTRW